MSAGALPPEFIFGSRRSSLIGCFSALCLHVSQLRPGLYCIVLSSRLCCLRVVCINMNEELLSLTVRWARLGCIVLTNTTSPPMPQKPPGKGGWDTATTTRQSARDARADSRSFLEALSAGRTQRSLRPELRPDMVIWAVYACMLGRTERSARLREPSFTPN
jgi:hypothetical protein